jgi:outer membrane receptor protein involved in Fe transport
LLTFLVTEVSPFSTGVEKMRRLILLFAVVAIALGLALPAHAQFARASLRGQVSDPDGAALPGVTIAVRNEASGYSRQTVTGVDGSYDFNGLTPGTYTVTFTLQGFNTRQQEGVQLAVGSQGVLNMTMTLGGVAETVTVTAETPLVETTAKEVGGQVTQEQFTALPSQNRSFVMFGRLLPGVNASPDTESTASDSLFINGQDDNNNSFNVDGANNDDDAIGGTAGAQTRTALDAIQELQILTSQFDAEFGRTQGGVINAVTKSGANDFHGSGFLYLQSASWNSENFFTARNDLDQPDADYSSIGGTIGGPIVRDKAHFFVSFERSKPNEGVSQNFSTRPDKNFSATEDNLLRNMLFKVDWQASASHKVSARYLQEYSPQFNQIIGGQTTEEAAREESDTDRNVIGSVDSVLSDTTFNNFRLSWTQEDVAFANPCFNDNGADFATQRSCDVFEDHPGWDGGTNTVAQDRVNNSVQLDDTLSMYVPDLYGAHDFRIGGQYSYRTVKFNNNGSANGEFSFPTDADFDANVDETYPEEFDFRAFGPSTSVGVPGNDTLGLFVQDDWEVVPNLTLNLGLRYDWEAIVDDANNLAPRLGFSWDPVGDGRTVIRGGYGRFYERLQVGTFNNFILDAANVTQGFFINTPQAGTDQQFFIDFARSRGITTLNDLRDALIAEIEAANAGLTILNTNPTVDNSLRRAPYADTFTIGAERELVEGVSLGADIVRTQNREILIAADLNPNGGADPATGGGGTRPDISVFNGVVEPRFSSITTYLNGGESDYTALQISAKRRYGDSPIGRFAGTLAYTLAGQEGNAEPISPDGNRFQVRSETGYDFDAAGGTINGIPYGNILGTFPDLGLNAPEAIGPASWHRDHILAASWTWEIPGTTWTESGGILFSGVYEFRTGDQTEFFAETFLDNGSRALSPSGSYDCNLGPGDPDADICQAPKDYNGRENGVATDSISRMDMSFRYVIPVERTNITVLFDIFNIFNTVNFGSSLGSTRPAQGSFLIPNSALQPREFQIGARIDF